MRDNGLVSISPNWLKSMTGIGNAESAEPTPAPIFSVRGLASSPLTNACTSLCRIRFLGPLPCTSARFTPSSRANFRTEGLACEILPEATIGLAPIGLGVATGWMTLGGSGAGRLGSGMAAFGASATFSGAAGLAGSATLAAAGASPSAASIIRINPPCAALSPTLILTSLTVPPKGAGISIEALSDSSVMSESSLLTVSPALTKTSITSTLSKFPISGTSTSFIAIF